MSDILASGLDKISVSLDGIHQEDLARYRTNADLDRIVSGIRGLLAERRAGGWNRPLVQVQAIMFPYNEIKEADVILFLKSLGVDRIKLKRPSFDTFGGRNDASGCFGGEMRDGPGRYSRKDRAYVKYRDRAVCRLLFQGFALSDGSVVPCCIDFDGASVFGNLHRQRWGEIWGSAARMDMLRRFFEGKLDVCTNCSLGYGYSNTVFDRADQDDAGSPQAASRS
jgi:MoaA/NifB/PqqE/SkfB family radical SAM enzyme